MHRDDASPPKRGIAIAGANGLLHCIDAALLLVPLVSLESCHARHCDDEVNLWNGRIRIEDPQRAVFFWLLFLTGTAASWGLIEIWERRGRDMASAKMPNDFYSLRAFMVHPLAWLSSKFWLNLLAHHRITIILYAWIMVLVDYYARLTFCLYTIPLVYTCIELSRLLIHYGIWVE